MSFEIQSDTGDFKPRPKSPFVLPAAMIAARPPKLAPMRPMLENPWDLQY